MAGTRCRIALVGAGRAATRHAATLARLHDVTIVGVTDPDLDAAARLAATTGGSVATNLSALLSLRPHAIYVCVPPEAHGALDEELVEAGLPLFLETPLGVDRDTPDELARRVASAGIVTSVAHFWRYSPAVARAKAVLAGRTIRLVTGVWLDTSDDAPWWGRRDRSGGPLIEQVVHLLDLLRTLVGEVIEVYAVTDDGPPPDVPGADVDGITVATLRFATGAVGTIASTCRFTGKRRAGLELFADGASVTITEEGCEIRAGGRSEWHTVDADESRRAATRTFIDAIRRPSARDGVLTDCAQAVRTHRLACAIARSAAEGRPLRLRAE